MGTAGLLGAIAVATSPAVTGMLLPAWGARTTCLALAGLLGAVALAASVARSLREAPEAAPASRSETDDGTDTGTDSAGAGADADANTDTNTDTNTGDDPGTAPAAPTALLLGGPRHETAAPPVCMDFQVKVGRPPGRGHRGPRPCVLVCTRTADREIDDLSLRLAAAGIPLLRFDSDRVPEQALMWNPSAGVLTTSEGSFRPVVSWLRYFTPGSVPAAADPHADLYRREQWGAWASIMASARTMTVLNRDAGPGHPDRVAQLADAHAVGLRTPATIVTSAPWAAARTLPGDGDVIVKAVGEHYIEPRPGHLVGLAPRRISRATLAAQRLEPAPVMVQEFLPAGRELRIYLAGDELITYAIQKPSPESLWTGDPGVYAAAVPTPRELVGPLRRLAECYQLDVAAFDLLDAEAGPVFLEVNSACDWLWSERLTGDALVSPRIADLVSQLFHAAASADASAGRTPALTEAA